MRISLDSISVLIGSAIIFFIPGWIWTYVFFDRGDYFGIKTESRFLRCVERFVLAVAFSLVLIPMSVFFLNIFLSIGATLLDSILISILPVFIGIFLYFAKKRGLLKSLGKLLNP